MFANKGILFAACYSLALAYIEQMQAAVKSIEKQLAKLLEDDPMVNRLLTIRGCGNITAWTIRAYTDDIKRFPSAKKYAAFCGLVPWVQNSNETIHHGKITKRGPQELRTAFVQLVMGLRRCKDTSSWRLMMRYEYLKRNKSSGKSIIATARKRHQIVWTILSQDIDFDCEKMKRQYVAPTAVNY